MNPLVWNQGSGPLSVILGIMLDQQHLPRLLNRLARLDQIDASIHVMVAQRTSAPDSEQVVIRRGRRVGHFTYPWTGLGSLFSGRVAVTDERRQLLQSQRGKGNFLQAG